MKMTRSALFYNVLAGVLVLSLLYWLWPELLHKWGFELLVLNWPLVLLFAFVVYVGRRGVDKFKNDRLNSRFVTLVTTALTVVSIFAGVIYAVRDYGTYLLYADFEKRTAHVESDPAFFRFTPLRVAYRNMKDTVNDGAETIAPELTSPIILKDGFGYAAPITPDGILPIFTDKISSVMVYRDRPGIIEDEDRRERIAQHFEVGPHMEWFDNLKRHLAHNDFFTTYDEPHLLRWEVDGKEQFVMAIPKTKYAWMLFPYWAGVTIVHPDGRLQDFTPETIASEPQLKGQWLYPQDLMLKYVNLQNFSTSAGFLGHYLQVSGKLEIYHIPDIEPDANSSASHMRTNQFPFLTKGLDGNVYHVVMTKAQGGGSGLFRAYYIDATTGTGTYLEYTKGQDEYGPMASLDRVKKLSSFNWRREAGESVSGNIVVDEPTYVVRAGDSHLYWKGTILATNFAAISATVVAPASHPEDFMLFDTRAKFQTWLEGGAVEEMEILEGEEALRARVEELILKLKQSVTDAESIRDELAAPTE